MLTTVGLAQLLNAGIGHRHTRKATISLISLTQSQLLTLQGRHDSRNCSTRHTGKSSDLAHL
jgi:hypothetical protein